MQSTRDISIDEDWNWDEYGPCCICGKQGRPNNPVRTVWPLPYRLDVRSESKGGCAVCGVGWDQALSILCDECADAYKHHSKPWEHVKYVMNGGCRIRFDKACATRRPFLHDMRHHLEEIEGLDALPWFDESPDAGTLRCWCSLCGQIITAKEAPVLRRYNDRNHEQRFHVECFRSLVNLEDFLP